MKRVILFTLIIIFPLSVFSQRTLSKTEIQNLKKQVKDIAQKTKSIKSDFIQYQHLDFLSNDIVTHGKLIYKTPSSVKWEYTKPYKYSVVFKDNILKINDDGKKNKIDLSGNKMFENMNKLIVKSINGDMFDDKMFKIKYEKEKLFYVISFTSKDKKLSEIISNLILYFDPKNYKVAILKMVEPSGDYTKIVFKNRVENQNISDAIFSN